MRKTISFFIVLCMLVVMIPLQGKAADTSMSDHYQLIELAEEVFPEYATLIRQGANTVDVYTEDQEDNIVHYEMRCVTDRESLSLVQYESGNILLIKATDSDFIVNEDKSDPTYEGSYKYGSVDYEVTCTTALGVFYLKNVCYEVSMNRTGKFISYGVPSINNSSDMHYNGKGNEPNEIKYWLTFNWNASKKTNADFRVTLVNGVVSGFVQD